MTSGSVWLKVLWPERSYKASLGQLRLTVPASVPTTYGFHPYGPVAVN